jgi:hypothetical protein
MFSKKSFYPSMVTCMTQFYNTSFSADYSPPLDFLTSLLAFLLTHFISCFKSVALLPQVKKHYTFVTMVNSLYQHHTGYLKLPEL